METFLSMVAQDLYTKIGNDLSRTAVVFPNKRARLFFNKQLALQSTRPVWSPVYLDISDLFRQLSTLEAGDPVRMVCMLYQVFREETGSEETLDDFYFWGELLISDFDDVDKNLVDAEKLFLNLQALKGIMEGNGFLDAAQEEAIRHFFLNFSVERQTELKTKFLSVWERLGGIYRRFRTRLEATGIAYEGMMYRRVLETLDTARLGCDRYVFVGFNALNRVEEVFFQRLQAAGKALFYWDYDTFYTTSEKGAEPVSLHEAGRFILHNLSLFPNQLPPERFDVLGKPKQIRFLSSPTENAQARYLPEWVKGIAQDGGEGNATMGEENAVVLCNETLLLPILHSIPAEVENVNITMGFPLAQTPVYGYLNAAVALQTDGYLKASGCYTFDAVSALLKHPYTRRLSAEAKALEKRLTERNRFYPRPSELQADAFLKLLFTPQEGIVPLCRYLTDLLGELAGYYQEDANAEGAKDEADKAKDAAEADGGKSGKDGGIYNQLYRESLFKAYTVVNRLLNLAQSGMLSVQTGTFTRLLQRLLAATRIPFHGEPAVGMQVMGVLETRNLDFRNLFILSLNEGKLPRSGTDASFIPYNLRKAFGMNTLDRENSVYAYYFYRLVQRAENITLAYSTATEGLNRGEMSRFMLQLLVEWGHPIVRASLEASHTPRQSHPITIRKTPEMLRRLYDRYDARRYGEEDMRDNDGADRERCEAADKEHNEATDREQREAADREHNDGADREHNDGADRHRTGWQRDKAPVFSPSALNIYLDCRLKFYYHYVAGLKPVDEVTAEIGSALFGTLFHSAAQHIYMDLTRHGNEVRKEDIDRLLKEKERLDAYVYQAFKAYFFHAKEEERPEYNGTQLIHAKVIAAYLERLLKIDREYAPFRIEALEREVKETMRINTPLGELPLDIGGIVDRMDSKDGLLRIIDYKTGGEAKPLESIEQLFTPGDKRPGYIFQTFLYAALLCRRQPKAVAPALLYIHKAGGERYSPVVEMKSGRQSEAVTDFKKDYDTEFRERLTALLQEIFNPDEPFTQTDCEKICAYCDFNRLCRR